MIGLDVRPFGEDALLVEVAGHEEALALYRDLRERPVPGIRDLVPAATTVLITFVHPVVAAAAAHTLATRRVPAGRAARGPLVEIPVVYDGPDLDAVAAHAGLTPADIVHRHTGVEHVVAFLGFAPGFAYLVGGDPALAVPRRDTPRTAVPRGSVALAGGFTACYPRTSPGGWQLIGRTDLDLWRLDRDPPALLTPGDRVRFRRVGP